MPQHQKIINLNTAALQEGLHLLSLLDVTQYRQGFKPAFQSNIGAHFRHVLEHYQCFLVQISEQEFRYDNRPRDQHLEMDIDYANETIVKLIENLSDLDESLFSMDYTVGEQLAENEAQIVTASTTLARELMFLQAHTVHHFAMIAAMCRGIGVFPEEGFGVAIPTRNYTKVLDKKKSDASKQESLCAQ